MGGRFRRWLVYPALSAIALVLVILLAAHTPWARSRALAWATDFVTRYDLVLQANSLSYNALTRRVTLTDVRLAATGHQDAPFLTAKRIEVTLPWSVYRRQFAIDQLDIDSGKTTIIRDENGVTNLPPGRGGPTPERPRRLRVYGLTLDTFDVSYVDRQHQFELTVPKIQADLRHDALTAAGLFAIRGETRLRMKERHMQFAAVEAHLAYDGSNIAFENLRLASPQIGATVKGRVDRVLDSPQLDLFVDGDVNLEPAAAWISPPPVKVSGVTHISGVMKGPFSEFVLNLDTRGTNLSIGDEHGVAMQGPVRVNLDEVTSDNITLTPATGGSIRATFKVPFGPGPSVTTAEWKGFDADSAFRLTEIDHYAIGAKFEGRLTFETGEGRSLDLFNRSTARGGAGDVPTSGTATFKIRDDAFTIDHDHQVNGMSVDGHMTGEFANAKHAAATLGGTAHARISDISAAMESLAGYGISTPPILRRFHGDLDVPAQLSGTFHEPSVVTHVTGQAVDVPNLGPVSLQADVVAGRHAAEITAVQIHRDTATVTGHVSMNVDREALGGEFELNAPDALVLEREIPANARVSGPMHATATLGGTFDAFHLDTSFTGHDLVIAGQKVDRASGQGVVTADTVDLATLVLDQGEGQIAGHVKYNWDTDALETALQGQKLTYRTSLLSENDTLATFSLTTSTAGTLQKPTGKIEGHVSLSGGAAGEFIGDGDLKADLLGDHVSFAAKLPDLGALVDGTLATAAPHAYNVNATLDRLDLNSVAKLIGATPGEILGFASGAAVASGRLDDDKDRKASVNVDELDAGVGGVAVSLIGKSQVTMAGDDITLESLKMRVGDGQLTAAGQWTTKLNGTFVGNFNGQFQDAVRMGRALGLPVTMDGSGALAVDFRSSGSRASTLATLSLDGGTFSWGSTTPLLRDLTVRADMQGETLSVSRITGRLSTDAASGDFSATGKATVPSFELAAIDGELTLDAARLTLSGVPVSQERPSRLRLSKGQISVADATWIVADNPLTFGGSVNLAGAETGLDLSAKGKVDLRILSAFVPTVAFDGDANVDARLQGTTAKPALDGRITLDSAEIALSDPRIVLSDLTGALRLSGESVVLENVKGSANGGEVSLGGNIDVTGLTLAGGAINIEAQGVAMEFPRGFRSEVDAIVTYDPSLKSPAVTGDIRVRESTYTDPVSLTALARRTNAQTLLTRDQSYVDTIRLNVSVTTTEDATIDNNYGRFEAGAEFRVVGTVGRPGMTGRVSLREGGQIFLAGRTFRVTRGDISFTDLRKIQPEFNVSAESRISGDTVTMTVTGSLDHPVVDLTSEAGSKTPGEIASSIVGSGVTAENALALLSADLLGSTGRAIGLSTLRVDRGDFTDSAFREDPSLIANETEPTTRLTVGRRINDKVEVTVSQNLRENGKATVIFSFYPKANVEIRALSRDNATVGAGVRHQVTLGEQKSRTTRPERPIVSSVAFSNLDPALDAQFRKDLKLEAGDRFEFINMQKDMDRLRARLHANGLFESRVRARRIDSEDGRSVAISYRVDLGPRTFLEVRGVELPASERAALEEAWTSSVFDQFLIDDLTNRVRRYLLTTGELAPVVVGRVDRAEGVKRLRIDVTPGAPITGRDIRFSGNSKLNTARLKQGVDAAGIELDAWLDRTVIEKTLRALYVEEGFLQTEITAQPLTIDGTVGVLPIEIVEGPQAAISAVNWSGVAEERKAMAEKALGIEPGIPYQPGKVADRREKVEDAYRGLGFAAVEINIRPDIDGADVILNFEVVEGARQVLSDVTVDGAEVTNGHVITEALKFELGKPVNQDEWAKARKRLYDTNVFRLVDIEAVPAGDEKNGQQPVRARVTVQEYPQWALRYGAQIEGERTPTIGEFATSRNLGIVGELKNPNLFGRALTFGLFGQYQYDFREATMFLSTSRLFGWPARSSLYGFYTRDRNRNDTVLNDISLISDRTGVSAEQKWKMRGAQVVYGYRFERNHTFDPNPSAADIIPLDVVANLATVSIASLLEKRDNPLDPHKGAFSSVSWEEGAAWLGSDIDNHKVLMQQFAFVPLGKRAVLASRVLSGFIFGQDPALPSDRFQAGGGTTVRGYGENALGPLDPFGEPLGGETLFLFNQEARFPIYKWIRGTGFVDIGNVFGRTEAFDWNQLKMGYGFGFRLETPAGLVRIDFGIPNDALKAPSARMPNSLQGGRWYFGLGHIF